MNRRLCQSLKSLPCVVMITFGLIVCLHFASCSSGPAAMKISEPRKKGVREHQSPIRTTKPSSKIKPTAGKSPRVSSTKRQGNKEKRSPMRSPDQNRVNSKGSTPRIRNTPHRSKSETKSPINGLTSSKTQRRLGRSPGITRPTKQNRSEGRSDMSVGRSNGGTAAKGKSDRKSTRLNSSH